MQKNSSSGIIHEKLIKTNFKPTESNTNLKYAAPKKNSEEITTESNTGLPNTEGTVKK